MLSWSKNKIKIRDQEVVSLQHHSKIVEKQYDHQIHLSREVPKTTHALKRYIFCCNPPMNIILLSTRSSAACWRVPQLPSATTSLEAAPRSRTHPTLPQNYCHEIKCHTESHTESKKARKLFVTDSVSYVWISHLRFLYTPIFVVLYCLEEIKV